MAHGKVILEDYAEKRRLQLERAKAIRARQYASCTGTRTPERSECDERSPIQEITLSGSLLRHEVRAQTPTTPASTRRFGPPCMTPNLPPPAGGTPGRSQTPTTPVSTRRFGSPCVTPNFSNRAATASDLTPSLLQLDLFRTPSPSPAVLLSQNSHHEPGQGFQANVAESSNAASFSSESSFQACSPRYFTDAKARDLKSCNSATSLPTFPDVVNELAKPHPTQKQSEERIVPVKEPHLQLAVAAGIITSSQALQLWQFLSEFQSSENDAEQANASGLPEVAVNTVLERSQRGKAQELPAAEENPQTPAKPETIIHDDVAVRLFSSYVQPTWLTPAGEPELITLPERLPLHNEPICPPPNLGSPETHHVRDASPAIVPSVTKSAHLLHGETPVQLGLPLTAEQTALGSLALAYDDTPVGPSRTYTRPTHLNATTHPAAIASPDRFLPNHETTSSSSAPLYSPTRNVQSKSTDSSPIYSITQATHLAHNGSQMQPALPRMAQAAVPIQEPERTPESQGVQLLSTHCTSEPMATAERFGSFTYPGVKVDRMSERSWSTPLTYEDENLAAPERQNARSLTTTSSPGHAAIPTTAYYAGVDCRTECPYCKRRFNPDVAERHIPRCKDVVHKPKPPANSNKRRNLT